MVNNFDPLGARVNGPRLAWWLRRLSGTCGKTPAAQEFPPVNTPTEETYDFDAI